jgi:NDP-sugar pyrophosphorylase family protein
LVSYNPQHLGVLRVSLKGNGILEPFVKFSDLIDTKAYNQDFFNSDNAFDYIGKGLKERLATLLAGLGVTDTPVIHGEVSDKATVKGQVYIAKGAVVGPEAYIEGPTFIDEGADIRHGAFIRGTTYVGKKAVVGHTTEVKGSVFCDDAKAGHFAYVGDSILGANVNLGAGTKLANFAFGGAEITYKDPETNKRKKSGLRKFGVFMGDGVNTGCNSVINPGAILYPETGVYPCVWFRGTLKSGVAK